MPATFDMRTTIGTYGAPEFHMMVGGSRPILLLWITIYEHVVALLKTVTSIMEAMMNTLTNLLSRSNVVHDPGLWIMVICMELVLVLMKHWIC